ncbi:hypothetical protein LTR85_001129 [Meristemomyces frigidus]|nr:hypothetical protein LTR85_001129 [Meristemomyces frigidus]
MLDALRENKPTVHEVRKLHESFLAGREIRRFPIMRLPPELRNEIYRHALTKEPYSLPGEATPTGRAQDARAFSLSGLLWNEANQIFHKEATLDVNLSSGDVCERRDTATGEPITYDSYIDGKIGPLWQHVRNTGWLTTFTNLVFTTGQPPEHPNTDDEEPTDPHWETTALNLQAMFSVRNHLQPDWKWEELTTFYFRVGLGGMAGLVPNLKIQQQLGLEAPPALTKLERAVCTLREHHGQMTRREKHSYTWRNPPANLTTPSQGRRFAFPTPDLVAIAHKLSVLTWLGNLAKSLGQKVMLQKNEDDSEGLEWIVSDTPGCELGCSQCEDRQPNSKCGGADVRDLYLLADQIEDEGNGLWLCSV